jgi:hypothetical protein
MTLEVVQQELTEHLVNLRIPRTIEPNPTPTFNSAYCVSPTLWATDPIAGLQLFKMWLDIVARGTDFPDYHTLKVDYDQFLGVKVTLSQGA